MGKKYEELHRRSIEHPEEFWAEQSQLIHWHRPCDRVLDTSRLPLTRWFVGGETNLCYNAVDRHLASRADQAALIWISTEVGEVRRLTFRELHREVNVMAATLRALGVERGDRVLLYMPMIAEGVIAMLACARIGAIHSVVFGGFAAGSLATRIDDARPKVIVTADGGMRAGKPIPYKPFVDEAIALAAAKPAHVLLVRRGLDPTLTLFAGRDHDYAVARLPYEQAEVPVVWLESSEPSYILYTSGTTGKPKGVQRDTGGYATALAASMRFIYDGRPGEVYFSTSDIGWVVGHSYIVYGPLIGGMTTIMYEGTPIRPDGGIWWKIVQDFQVSVMFSSPTAIRLLKKQDPALLSQYDLSSLRYLFLAGEPLDEPTARWISEGLGKPVIDNYWQTETGWPILSAQPGVEPPRLKFGSPSFASYGYNVQIVDADGQPVTTPGEKGTVVVVPPLPPGCMTTVWGDDQRFIHTYFKTIPGRLLYSTFDWGIRDEEGYYFILGRTDDVINVAGHRLGTREIEETINMHGNVAESAVVGVADQLKGQVAVAFAVLKDVSRLATPEGRAAAEKEVLATVDKTLGAVARPAQVHFVPLLPKTRSGKILRRAIQAVCEGREAGDLTTIEDPVALAQIKASVEAKAAARP